jgi:hypothetical protein
MTAAVEVPDDGCLSARLSLQMVRLDLLPHLPVKRKRPPDRAAVPSYATLLAGTQRLRIIAVAIEAVGIIVAVVLVVIVFVMVLVRGLIVHALAGIAAAAAG